MLRPKALMQRWLHLASCPALAFSPCSFLASPIAFTLLSLASSRKTWPDARVSSLLLVCIARARLTAPRLWMSALPQTGYRVFAAARAPSKTGDLAGMHCRAGQAVLMLQQRLMRGALAQQPADATLSLSTC